MIKNMYVIILIFLIICTSGCYKKNDVNNSVSNENIEVNINVDYEKKFGGDNDDYWICIDNNRIEKISCGNKVSYNAKLPSGKHIFHMESELLHKSDEIEFQVSKNAENINFKAEGSLWAGVNATKN